MYCHKCGTKLDDNATSCYTCGASQGSVSKNNNTDNSDRTYGIFTGSVPNTSMPSGTNRQTITPRKKSEGLLIGLITGGVALLLVVVFIIVAALGNNESTDNPVNNNPGTSTTTNTTVNHEAEILDCINQSKTYADNENFTEALAVLDTAEQLYGKDSRIDEQRKNVSIAKVLNEVSGYEAEKNYVKAIECISNSPETVKNDTDVIQKLNSLKITYSEFSITEAEKAFNTSGYTAAIDILNESLKLLPGDEKITTAIKRYEEYTPVNVATLEYFTGNDFALENNIKDNLGNVRNNVVSPKPVGWSNAATTNIYKLNKQYSRLSGVWFQLYDFRTEVKYGVGATDYPSKLEIHGDGKLLYSGEMKVGIEPKNINLDISGVTELKIYYFGGGSDGSYSGIADFNVQK